MSTIVYVYAMGSDEYTGYAARFVKAYADHPPGCEHDTIVVTNGGKADTVTRMLFAALPNLTFVEHDDSGWDIGAFRKVAKSLPPDAMVMWFGGPSHFRKAGWLKRMADVWAKYGPGFYGTLSSYEVRPHMPTTGFVCPPSHLLAYSKPTLTRPERYEFEHGPMSISRLAMARGLPCKLVTWDGEWDWRQWRKPQNIYCSGDHSNCLTLYRHTDSYEDSDPREKQRRKALADTITTSYP